MKLELTFDDLLKKPILDFRELLIYTGFSEPRMRQIVAERKIPCSRPGGNKLFFDRRDVDAWLMSNPVPTRDELNKRAHDIAKDSLKTKRYE